MLMIELLASAACTAAPAVAATCNSIQARLGDVLAAHFLRISQICTIAFMLQVMCVVTILSVVLITVYDQRKLTLILMMKRSSAVKTMLAAATMMPAPAALGLSCVIAMMYTL
jgi:hypothetical protein